MADECDISKRPPAAEGNPSPQEIEKLLRSIKTIAVVGLSNKPHRESYMVAGYLQSHGYEILPVNPALADKGWEGTKAYASLSDVPGRIDLVDLFRRAELIDEIVDGIIAIKPKAAWLQLGIVNNEAARKLRAAGIMVVQDKCMKIEHSALIGG